MNSLILVFFSTFSSTIITGIFVMIALKTKLLKNFTVPIDFNRKFIDGKPIFGSSKTFRGLLFYLFFGAVSGAIWFFICDSFAVISIHNLFLAHNRNTLIFNSLIGMILGLTYAIFELPNSFLKRRLGINPSKGAKSFLPKTVHFLIDQIDSVIGCLVILWIFYPELSFTRALLFLIIGGVTHIVINLILFELKIRKRPV